MSYDGVAVLPTRTNVNPNHPEGAQYVQEGDTLYVLSDIVSGKPKRLMINTGAYQPSMALGTVYEYHHDQAGYSFGHLEVTGIHHLSNGRIEGELPDRKIAAGVFK